jgi:hypothetical protein
MKQQMYNEIDDHFSNRLDFVKSIGSFKHAELKFAYPQCSFPCESAIKDIEFYVYGSKGCVRAWVVTDESFPNYEIKSMEIMGGVVTKCFLTRQIISASL